MGGPPTPEFVADAVMDAAEIATRLPTLLVNGAMIEALLLTGDCPASTHMFPA